MVDYQVLFGVLAVVCAIVVYISRRESGGQTNNNNNTDSVNNNKEQHERFKIFQLNYLVVYLLMMGN
jgi:hypothetical protein